MNKFLIAALAVSVSVTAASAQTTPAKTVKPATVKATTTKVPAKSVMKNLNDSFSYAAGCNIATSMKEQGITKLNSALMQRAVDDIINNRTPLLTTEEAGMTLQKQLQEYAKKKSDAEKAAGEEYLALNKKRAGVTTLPNGLQYEVMKAGDPAGAKPTLSDTVVVHYVGTFTNGKEFDNSVKRGEPATFQLTGVIKGWTEILQQMTKGAKWKVYIPSELGYGPQGYGGAIPPNATLVFEIELLDIKPSTKQ